MRQKRYRTNPEHTKLTLDALWSAAAQAEGKHTTTDFLRGVLTETEQLQIGRRLLIAKRLLSGHSWSHIRADLQVSPNTINLVQTWMAQQIPEYASATQARIDRTKKSDHLRKRIYDPNSFQQLRRRYPDHFLLWNLIANDTN